MSWIWLTWLACAPRGTAQLDDLMDLGAYEVACERARDGGEAVRAHVDAGTWAATRVQLQARPLSEEELGGAPQGWAAWDVSLAADAGVVPTMRAQLSLVDADGARWSPCADCGPEWVMQQLSPGDVVEITWVSHDASGGGGGLFRALGKVVLVTLGLPLALTVDLMLAPMQVLGGDVTHLGAVTRWVLDPTPLPVASLPRPSDPHDAPAPARATRLRVLRAEGGAGPPVEATVSLTGAHLGGCPVGLRQVSGDLVDGQLELAW